MAYTLSPTGKPAKLCAFRLTPEVINKLHRLKDQTGMGLSAVVRTVIMNADSRKMKSDAVINIVNSDPEIKKKLRSLL